MSQEKRPEDKQQRTEGQTDDKEAGNSLKIKLEGHHEDGESNTSF